MSSDKPLVGIGVIIVGKDGHVLIGKRIGKHAPKFSIPGGLLEVGETFETAAIREVSEETSIRIQKPKVIAITNNLETYREEGIHTISVILLVEKFTGKPKVTEPDKCEQWLWCDPHSLPDPHFDASRLAIVCYLKGKIYEKI